MDSREAQTELRKFIRVFKSVENVVEALQAADKMDAFIKEQTSKKPAIMAEISRLESQRSRIKETYDEQVSVCNDRVNAKRKECDGVLAEYQEKMDSAKHAFSDIEKEIKKQTFALKADFAKLKTSLNDEREQAELAVQRVKGGLQDLRSRLSNVG